LKTLALNSSRPEVAKQSAFDCVKISKRKEKIVLIKNKLGPIPDDHFENEPTFPAKNVSPLSKEWLDEIEKIKAERDKYRPGDVVGGY
jgi:phosphoenolpyruvate synthase/pyruvate phosphate dikinase